MKWMTRLRLINWHYFKDVTMEFGRQTLITGQNAAGKSTIIDALQVLFVVDQRLIRFNAAAHDEAKRSFENYLMGKIGSDERSYVRDGDFTTYIIAEFRDEDKKESFVIGAAIDVYRDRSYEEEYFILAACKLDQLDFINPQGQLLNREAFKRRYGAGVGTGLGEGDLQLGVRQGSKRRALFERNKSNYQKALLARLGQLQDRFFHIFTKALSFKPIRNIRTFVYDYILDKRELQLDLMKQNFEIHERYRQELELLQKRKLQLQGIRDGYQEYARLKETIKEQDYVIRKLKVLYETENLEQQERFKQQAEENLAHLLENTGFAEFKLNEAREQSQLAYQRWQNHAAERRKKELEAEIRELETKRVELEKLVSIYCTRLDRERQLLENFSTWTDGEYWSWETGEREQIGHYTEHLAGLLAIVDIGKAEELDEEIWAARLATIAEARSGWYDRLLIGEARLLETLNAAEEQATELENIIRDLEQKRRSYAEPVRQLKALLEDRLRGRSAVWIFCEEAELVDEGWRDALEGYLNTQRFDLLVEPECFAEALGIYEREKWTRKLEGVGLVDTEKERKYLGTAESGSLAHELVAEHPVVRARAEHLLGRVMKAKDEQELRRHRTAITRSCMVYNNLVARQIPKKYYEIPYIGTKAIARQLEIRKLELQEIRETITRLRELGASFREWLDRFRDKDAVYNALSSHLTLPRELETCRFRQEQVQLEWEGLNLAEAERLKADYEHWREAEKHWKEKWGGLLQDKGTIEAECKQLAGALFVQQNRVRDTEVILEQWVGEYGAESEQRAKQRYEEAERSTTASTFQKLQNWERSSKGLQTKRDDQFNDVAKLRQKYNVDNTFNGDANDSENDAYDRLLDTIEHLNIPEYQQKVAEALAESEEEFKSHFVFKLREAIEMARREFQQLNYALRNFPFSDDKYHFEVSPSERYKKFYEAVMDPLLMEKGSLFDLPENDRTAVLHELFEMLVRGEAGQMEEYADYRQYLDFDIIVSSSSGGRYRFSQVLKEKSGGETQTPFYIAILASFHHLYSNKSSRLVVFDEAFNKMDEQRIQSSLRLIKQMGLQLVAAVPDEKMQHMAPEVTTTLFVSKHDYQCFVDMIDRWVPDEAETSPAFHNTETIEKSIDLTDDKIPNTDSSSSKIGESIESPPFESERHGRQGTLF
ncbi:ATP-binding protein [Paenibacillus alvei]|uniref:ATP-binding protein n=1 Tax=Paenibacillus alvei TaxID=44250 RepID=UPI0013DD61FD|nr:SbcC/MukB-like Walker B domain-containing protein [Paenibacillus alvei]NEZ42594.1 ATPase [Paenibacillus alvei]